MALYGFVPAQRNERIDTGSVCCALLRAGQAVVDGAAVVAGRPDVGVVRSKRLLPDRERAAKGEMSFWEYDEKGYIIAGTPERVEQRIRELATELRVGQLIACLHMGNLPEEVASENTYLFGTKVIPKLRDLWSEEPDYWTPAISQERVARAEKERSGDLARP